MKNNVAISQATHGEQKLHSNLFRLNDVKKNHKNYFYLILFATLVIFSSCTAQSRFSSRLTSEWTIEKFEVREANGGSTTVENAGSITFDSNGEGTQSFTTAVASAGQSVDSDFQWENTAQTVTINAANAEHPKVWIVVKSQRASQEWYSTDSMGNVQVMHLKKK